MLLRSSSLCDTALIIELVASAAWTTGYEKAKHVLFAVLSGLVELLMLTFWVLAHLFFYV